VDRRIRILDRRLRKGLQTRRNCQCALPALEETTRECVDQEEAVGDLSRMALRIATRPRDVLAKDRSYLWRCALSTVDYGSLVRDVTYPLVVRPRMTSTRT